MPIRTNGGVFSQQMLTGSLVHYVVCGADFSGAINSFGQPVPFSCAEIIFNRIESGAYIDIMNPNSLNLSFALEADRSIWNEASLQIMIRSLGTNVGVDHINCSVLTVKEVPYIWSCCPGDESFLDLTDTPLTYAGAAGYVVTVNPTETGLIFTPGGGGTGGNTFSTINVPTQPSITAVGNDTLTFIAGSNVSITTNSLAKSITINSTGGSSTDYIPVPSGTTLTFSNRYFVTGPYPVLPAPLAFVTLPLGTGSGRSAGTSIIIAKPANASAVISLLVNTQGADLIATDLGSTNSVEFDATQEIILVFDGVSTWNLQIGTYI
jgi:hypothetical protein